MLELAVETGRSMRIPPLETKRGLPRFRGRPMSAAIGVERAAAATRTDTVRVSGWARPQATSRGGQVLGDEGNLRSEKVEKCVEVLPDTGGRPS